MSNSTVKGLNLSWTNKLKLRASLFCDFGHNNVLFVNDSSRENIGPFYMRVLEIAKGDN